MHFIYYILKRFLITLSIEGSDHKKLTIIISRIDIFMTQLTISRGEVLLISIIYNMITQIEDGKIEETITAIYLEY